MIEVFYLPEKIETERLVLIKRNHDFDEQMWQALEKNRDFLRRYLFWVDKSKSFEDVVGATDMFAKQWDKHIEMAYIVTNKKTNELLGCVGAHAFDFTNRHAEIGYWLREDMTGLGYMSEAVQVLEKELFAHKIRRLGICCDKENRASANVAIRNGYFLETTRKEALYTYGEFHDEEVYVKINS